MQLADKQQLGVLVSVVVVSVAVAGFFTGLQSPMNPATQPANAKSPLTAGPYTASHKSAGHKAAGHKAGGLHSRVIPAVSYADMAAAVNLRGEHQRTRLRDLKANAADPLAVVEIKPGEKQAALAQRAKNRAFNGAPPTIPHAVTQRSAMSCMACHGQGALTASLRIPQMSHPFLASCTQCHVESNPQHMQASLFRENLFEGLPAPHSGPRAYSGAPPQMPHSTLMRNNCTSCHGPHGQNGIRTTHPWRRNCTQCHAPPAALQQAGFLADKPQFLPGPKLERDSND